VAAVSILRDLAYICKCYVVPWPGGADMVAVTAWCCSGGGVDGCIISFEGESCTKVGQPVMRSVRLGGQGWSPCTPSHWDIRTLAMTGRDKLRKGTTGLGRTGHLSVPLSHVWMAGILSKSPILSHNLLSFSLQQFLGWEEPPRWNEWALRGKYVHGGGGPSLVL
jgi:hypothetical protein